MILVFKKGDVVVYPHHGAGTIEAIQEKSVFDEKQRYYILKLAVDQITISVPVSNSQELGLRNVISKKQASNVIKVLKSKKQRASSDYNERFKVNNEKLNSGDVFAVAEVVRDLNTNDGLSAREKRMFNKARDILISELKYTLKKSEEEVSNQLNTLLT